MNVYRLKILTPEKKIFDEEAVSLTITGEDGKLTVMAKHAPMVAMLVEGPVIIRTQRGTLEGIAGRGILQAGHNVAAAMVHFFQWVGEETEEEETGEGKEGAARQVVENNMLL